MSSRASLFLLIGGVLLMLVALWGGAALCEYGPTWANVPAKISGVLLGFIGLLMVSATVGSDDDK